MKRARRWILRILGALVVIVVIAVWYALSSERVAHWAVGFGLNRAPAGLSVGEVRGRLRGPLTLVRISYRAPTMSVTVDSVVINWRLSHLILRQLQLDRLHVTGVRVVLPDSTPPDTTTRPAERARPHLPLDVHLGDVNVHDVEVKAGTGTSLRLDSLRMTGRAAAYRFLVDGSVSTEKIRRAALHAGGSGTLESIALDTARGLLLGGNVTVRGDASWWPAIRWNGRVHATDIHPGPLTSDSTAWPGAVTFTINTAGTLDSVGPHGTVQLDSLGGALRHQPLTGQLRAQMAGRVYQLDTLSLGWGSITLAAAGKVGDTLSLKYRLTGRDLRPVSPAGSGVFDFRGDAAGPRTAPHVRVDGHAERIASGSTRVARVTLHANVELAAGGRAEIALHADSAVLSGQPVRQLALITTGTRDRHHIDLHVNADRGNLALAAAGGFDGTRWSGAIDTLRIDSTSAGRWDLQRRATVMVSAASIRLDTLCLVAVDSAGDHDSTTAFACAAGAKRSSTWHASVVAQRLPLEWIAPPRTDADSLVGTADLRVLASGNDRRVNGTADVAARDAALLYHEPGDKKAHRLALDSAALHAEIGGRGLAATLSLRVTNERASELAKLDGRLTIPGMTTLGGSMDAKAFDAHVEGGARDLGFLRPFLSGVDSLSGGATLTVSASGTIGAPHIDGEAHLSQLVASLPQQRSLRGSLDLTLKATPRHGRGADDHVSLTPHELRYTYRDEGREHWLSLDGEGLRFASDGSGGHGTLGLVVASDRGTQVATFDAKAELPQYAGDLPLKQQPVTAGMTADIADLGVLQLFTAQVDSLAGRFKLQIDLKGKLDAPTVVATANIDSLRAFFPFGTMVRGGVAAELNTTVAADNALTGDFKLTPEQLTFEYHESETLHHVALDSTSITGTAGPNGIVGTLALRVADQGTTVARVDGSASLPNYSHAGRPIRSERLDATLAGKITDLGFVRAFTPLVDSAAGNIVIDSKVTGTVADSRMAGTVEAHKVALHLPRLGVLYSDVEVAATGDQAGAVTLNASMKSGRGTLTLAGTSPVKPTAAQPGHVHIEGTNFEAANSAQLRTVISPKIDVTLTDQTMQVRGQVEVPIARLQLAEIPQTAVAPSDDVVLIDSVTTVRQGPALDADVRVVLGDSVSFSGFNFNALLKGALRVIERPHQLATASGEIVIDSGSYKAYGQDLTISQGKIRFAGGAIDNPAIDIRATRTADSVVAGLDMKGTLKAPQVSVFSQPAMSQTEALSYIVTGHAAGQSGASSGNLVSKALSALGLRGGNAVAGVLGNQLHLSEARIQTEGDIKKASFVAGTYLSPNLYVSYGIGLFDPVSTLRLRYMVSGHFTLQAETGKSTGADVLVKTTSN